jgi:probable addiction module antidote protein
MPIKTTPFDPAEYLNTPEEIAAYLEDAFASGDRAEIADALGVVARSHGMSQLAQEAGLTRQTLYQALSAEGDPRLSTFLGVVNALGLKLHVTANAA